MLTAKQLQDRRKGIGGSDVAAICGLVKTRTPYQVYCEKLYGKKEDVSNSHAYWGHKLEPQVADEYALQTGKELQIIEDTLFSPTWPFMLANIDRKIKNENAILECKTSVSYLRDQWGEAGTDDIPTPYLLQCAHYAITLDAEYVDLAVLIDSHDFRIYRYERNPLLEERLIEKEQYFWHEHVAKKIPPPPINHEDAQRIWKQPVQGKFITANTVIQNHLSKLNAIKKQIKDLTEAKSSIELFIKNYLTDAEGLTDEFGQLLVSWRGYESYHFNVNKFKEDHPELYLHYLNKNHQRRFMLHLQEESE